MKILKSKRDVLSKIKRSLLSKQIIFFSNRYKNPVILLFYSPSGFISAIFRSVARIFKFIIWLFYGHKLGCCRFPGRSTRVCLIAPWFMCASVHLAQRQYCMVAMTLGLRSDLRHQALPLFDLGILVNFHEPQFLHLQYKLIIPVYTKHSR